MSDSIKVKLETSEEIILDAQTLKNVYELLSETKQDPKMIGLGAWIGSSYKPTTVSQYSLDRLEVKRIEDDLQRIYAGLREYNRLPWWKRIFTKMSFDSTPF